MSKIPTDLEIIEDIYYRYFEEFRSYAKEQPDRIARIRVPVDLEEIADACGVEEELIFGRIYYHFNKKYSYKDENGETTTFFMSDKFEGLTINFPLVASVLAELYLKQKDKYLTIGLSATALLLSVVAAVIAILS